MSEHRATVEWQRSGEFRYETYSRAHTLRFDDISVPGSAAPTNIPSTVPKQSGVDPAHQKCFIANSVKTEVLIEPC